MYGTSEGNAGDVRDNCICAQSNARFLLTKIQLDHILSNRDPRQRLLALSTVPKDIGSKSLHHYRIDKVDKELALVILAWLYRAQRNLLMDELLEGLARDFLLSPTDIIECCGSLVLHEESSGLFIEIHTLHCLPLSFPERLPRVSACVTHSNIMSCVFMHGCVWCCVYMQ